MTEHAAAPSTVARPPRAQSAPGTAQPRSLDQDAPTLPQDDAAPNPSEVATPKVSVVIPVYNVEPYLAQCLDSVCNQTLEDIEIIVVDDDSPDKSSAVIERYTAADPRVVHIKHPRNLGLGGVRNTGIAAARGEYQWHIDGDDFIDTNACRILYETARSTSVDVLTFSGINVSGRGAYLNNYFSRNKDLCNRAMPGIEFMRRAREQNTFYCAVWLNLYRREFIKEFSKEFQFRLNCAHQDTDHTPILYSRAPSVYCIHYAPYFRLIRDDSITAGPETQKRMRDKLAVTTSLLSYIEGNGISFIHPLSEFAFRDYNYFKKLYAKNFTGANEEFSRAFDDINLRFSKLKEQPSQDE